MPDNPEALCRTCWGSGRCTDCDGDGCRWCEPFIPGRCGSCDGTGERPDPDRAA